MARPVLVGLAIVTFVLASACTNASKGMDSWVGSKDADLVSKWGAPARSITLSDSSRVMTWTSIYVTGWPYKHDEVCERSFTVSRGGVVIDWATRNC